MSIKFPARPYLTVESIVRYVQQVSLQIRKGDLLDEAIVELERGCPGLFDKGEFSFEVKGGAWLFSKIVLPDGSQYSDIQRFDETNDSDQSRALQQARQSLLSQARKDWVNRLSHFRHIQAQAIALHSSSGARSIK